MPICIHMYIFTDGEITKRFFWLREHFGSLLISIYSRGATQNETQNEVRKGQKVMFRETSKKKQSMLLQTKKILNFNFIATIL